RDTILLEQIQEQNRATLEAVFSLDQKLTRQREESELKLTRRLDALEAAVRINGEDIRKNSEDIRKNSQDIQRMTQEIREKPVNLERKADQAALTALEQRVSVLEKRIGL